MFPSTPAFQGNYTLAPATTSPTLPCELVERILLLLDLKLVLTCRLVNREFNELIQSSTLLQYFLACEAVGVIDNHRSSLSYPERLEALKKREEAWKKLKPIFETTIKVNHQSSQISTFYGLTGGAYFLDDMNLKDLHYFPLPSSPQDNPRWIKIPPHPGEGGNELFVNFALSEYEHDLMIKVICSDIGDQSVRSINLVFLKLSTGEYHPLARRPRKHIYTLYFSEPPCVIPRIVGDNLALVVHHKNYTTLDGLFILDWKTGCSRLRHRTAACSYPDLVFVSPELLLVPNLFLSHFEVWHIPPSHPNPNPPAQILSLKIPDISPPYSLFSLGCNGMPNPFPNFMPYFPPRPFFSSPENFIIVANIRLTSLPEMITPSYTLVMHRCALLEAIKKWTSPSVLEQQLDIPIWLTNEVNVHKLANVDDGSVRLDIQSKLCSTMPHPRSSPRTPGSSTTSYASKYDFLQLQWTDWGPPISRLLQVSATQVQRIGSSAGQRYAFTVPSPRDTRKLMVSVADFNPYNVRRNVERMARLRGEEEGDGDNCDDEEGKMKEDEWEKLDHEGVFSEDVYMGLKCVIYHAPDEYEFDQLLMDEERLVGLELDDSGRDESVKVLYIG